MFEKIKKKYKLFYYNPKSSKYYNGFRYKKKKNIETWYDENNIERKVIDYYPNGNKCYEVYFNEKGQYHNENDYAYQFWGKYSLIVEKIYFINGIEVEKI